MPTVEKIEILLNRKKLRMMLFGSIAFVLTGLWFIIKSLTIQGEFSSYPILYIVAGIASVLFFGYCAFMIFKKLKQGHIGLIVDETGITDNASGISAGHIPWNNIKEIKSSEVMSQKFLLIIVDNPQDFIKQQKSPIKRKTSEINFKNYGSPISISANTLQYNFDELRNLLEAHLIKNKT